MRKEGIQISTTELEGIITKISRRKQKLQNTLRMIKKEVHNLQHHWDSDASREIQRKMSSMEKRFQRYDEVMEEYIGFLRTAICSYETTETDRKNAAAAFEEY